MNILILAGGFGERLWPVSSKEFPKQFMALENGLSFLQRSLERSFLLKPQGNIFIVTRQDILQTTIEQCAQYAQSLSDDNKNLLEKKLIVIAEPSQKHTAPPIALVSRYIQAMPDNGHPLLVLTSDHIISPFESFKNDVEKAIAQANKETFVCFAIPPTEASTGFGYMQVSKTDIDSIFKIDMFKEKPDSKTAQTYLEQGNFWWNSGMFCVKPSTFIQELQLHTKEFTDAFIPLTQENCPSLVETKGIKNISSWAYMEKAYENSIAISVDHAVAEKSEQVFAIKSSFDWHDIGTWDSFASHFENNNETNATVGNVAQTDCKNCFVYSDAPVVLCGVEDLLVSVKDGNVLIMKKGSSESIKETVRQLIINNV